MKCKYIAALSVIVLVFFGCMATTKSGEKGSPRGLEEYIAGTVLLDESGVTDLKPGDTAAVVLEENPSTGYKWEITMDPEGALVEVEKRSFQKGDKNLRGAPKIAVWKFNAKSEGDATLTFNYLRPWEGEESIKETVVYKASIKK